LRASVYDLVPIGGCLAAVGALSAGLRLCRLDVFGRLFTQRATADATNFAVTVFPVGIMLSTAESGGSAASWGKRRGGLRVVDASGRGPGLARALLRNTVKLAAWQCAHLGLLRVTGAVEHRHAYRVGSVLLWGSYLISAVDLVPALARSDGRALHDLAAGTRVAAC
jgi:uncharacterized RDD family membrane protein YckC